MEKNDHYAFDNDCPAILTQQEILKDIIEKDRLNLIGYTTGQTTLKGRFNALYGMYVH